MNQLLEKRKKKLEAAQREAEDKGAEAERARALRQSIKQMKLEERERSDRQENVQQYVKEVDVARNDHVYIMPENIYSSRQFFKQMKAKSLSELQTMRHSTNTAKVGVITASSTQQNQPLVLQQHQFASPGRQSKANGKSDKPFNLQHQAQNEAVRAPKGAAQTAEPASRATKNQLYRGNSKNPTAIWAGPNYNQHRKSLPGTRGITSRTNLHAQSPQRRPALAFASPKTTRPAHQNVCSDYLVASPSSTSAQKHIFIQGVSSRPLPENGLRRTDINYFRVFRDCLSEYEAVDLTELIPNSDLQSFKQLMQELNAINEVLRNRQTPWNSRLQNIIWIQSCLVSPAILKMPQIHQFLNKVVDTLLTQLFDQRAVITKEVCKTISLMAEILQAEFEPHIPIYLGGSCLFKLMESGNHVMAEQAHLAILSILYNSAPIKLLKIILQQALDKHNYKRINCAEYILLILINTLSNLESPSHEQTTPASSEQHGVLGKHALEIMKYIEQIIQDSNATVRRKGRMILMVFENMYSDMAGVLISRLDSSYQKSIFDQYLYFGLDPTDVEVFACNLDAGQTMGEQEGRESINQAKSPISARCDEKQATLQLSNMQKKDLDSLTLSAGNQELKSRSSEIIQAITRNQSQPDALYPSKTNIIKGSVKGSIGITAEMQIDKTRFGLGSRG